jgi:hypothetical protein
MDKRIFLSRKLTQEKVSLGKYMGRPYGKYFAVTKKQWYFYLMNMPPAYRYPLLLTALFCLMTCWFFFIDRPLKHAIAVYEQTISAHQIQYERMLNAPQECIALQALYQDAKLQLDHYHKTNTVPVAKIVTSIAETNKLHIKEFNQKKVGPGSQHRIHYVLRGSYDAMLSSYKQLSDYAHIRIESVHITLCDKNIYELDGTLAW